MWSVSVYYYPPFLLSVLDLTLICNRKETGDVVSLPHHLSSQLDTQGEQGDMRRSTDTAFKILQLWVYGEHGYPTVEYR